MRNMSAQPSLLLILAASLAPCFVAINAAAQPAADGPPRAYKSYDYQETAEGMLKEVRLSIPEGLATVRGLLVVSNPAGGDTRGWYAGAWYGEFLRLHDFAFLGTRGFTSHVESLQVMQHALAQIANDAAHGELVNVPYATTGFSAGGGFASRLLVEVPDRVIACVPVSSRLNFTGITPSPAHLATPACVISGELEPTLTATVEPVLAACRPRGALFGWMTVQGGGHSKTDQDVFALAYLDAAVRLRMPADADVRKGPIALKALNPDAGWIADNTTWKRGLTRIAPAREFKGEIEKSSWLPTQDLAFIYRAYATYDRPLRIVSPHDPWNGRAARDPGSSVEVTVDDAKFPGWRKLEFYDGTTKLGEITAGPARFTARDLSTGLHVFSVLGTNAAGDLRSSNPTLVVVRRP
jgi:hypothetical protein